MIIYLTYNDHPSGVFWSQVTDVVAHLNGLGDGHVRLVALVSFRGYIATRRAIRQRSPDALVLPMFPRANNWRLNWLWLLLVCIRFRPTGIIGRGVFATALALRMRRQGRVQRVVLDGRGAYGAEWEEYRIVDDDRLIEECGRLEREAVLDADMRLAVSEALVNHWRQRFGYASDHHVVVPCTLGRDLDMKPVADPQLRASLGWADDDIVLVYSGSTVGWQSLGMLTALLADLLDSDNRLRVLFLTKEDDQVAALENRYPYRVARRWLPHDQVLAALAACDIGLLVREASVTNRVASPTKFAEYLSAGAYVIASEGLGDVAGIVREHRLGWVNTGGPLSRVERPSAAERDRLRAVVRERFSKSAFNAQYLQLLRCLGPRRVRAEARGKQLAVRDRGLVSIVVPSYNKGRYVREMVASVQAQTYPEWELLVVDDGSTDETRAILAELAASDPRIKLHPQEGNRGANYCRNLGVELAQGERIMFLDADDVLGPDCLERRIASDPSGRCDLVISTMEVFRHVPGEGGNRWVPSAADPLAEFLRHNLPWSVMQPLWRADFLRGLGGFDIAFPRHQDVEFHTRALLHPSVRYMTLVEEPDCFYRIAEERKVLKPFALLSGYTDSALLYYTKFIGPAKAIGKQELLLGIIYQTLVQLVLGRKSGLITKGEHDLLHKKLFAAQVRADLGAWKSLLMALSAIYHGLPVRVPGINRMFYWMVSR